MDKEAIKKLIEKIGPWFITVIWPIVQDKFVSIFAQAFDWFIDQFSDIFKSKNKARAAEAEKKANEAEEKASMETDENFITKHKTEAVIWREVAEQYKEDLIELSARVSELEEKTKRNMSNEVNDMSPDAVINEAKPSFSLKKWLNKIPKVNM